MSAVASTGIMVAGILGLLVSGPGRRYRIGTGLLLGVGLLGGVATLGLGVLSARKGGLTPADVLRLLTKIWVHPERDGTMFLLGVLVSLPLVAFFTHVLLGDSDSARLVASINYVEHQDWHYLIHTQENYLPHLIMGPILAIGGIAAVKALTILTVQALAGIVSFISWKLTRSWLGAVASILALLSFQGIVARTAYLPMYPAMLALGYTGTYLAYRAIASEGRKSLAFATFAGLCLAMSPEAQPVGQAFLLLPVLLAVGVGLRRALPGLLRTYAALALFLLPRAVINLSEGAFSHFLSYRVDYWITKGYLNDIQKKFFKYPSRLGYPDYMSSLVRHLPRITGRGGLVVVLLGLAGIMVSRPKVRRFGLIACLYLLAPLVVARGPFLSRYYSPLFVGAAIAAALLLAPSVGRIARGVSLSLVAMLLVLALVNLGSTLKEIRVEQAKVLSGPYRQLASLVDDGGGVIGARSAYLLFVDPHIRTYGSQFLSEREYVTYLTWPSDEAVVRVLRAHRIRWVLIMTRRWEVRYNNAWLLSAYEKPARHYFSIDSSPQFCLELEAPPFRLYKLGCPSLERPG
ncbi:MAG TPA: hypothetical protein VEQ37_13840 [Actinomycetota bacterium]|nr:hypothetical protein [Actinomycetota bacterium]